MATSGMRVLAAMLLIACGHGSSTKNTVPNELLDPGGHAPDPNEGTPPVTGEPAVARTGDAEQPPLSAEQACGRISTLMSAGCQWAQRFPPQMADQGVCEQSLAQWFAPSTPGHEGLEKLAACWALDCDGAESCMVRVQSAAPPPPPRTCGEEGTGLVYVDKAQFEKRRGANVTRFSDVKTSQQEPVEMCGIEGEVEWMARATCNGGTHPFASQAEANEKRDGWVARGGRCNSILDRYTVACPEATYTVFVDRYICPTP